MWVEDRTVEDVVTTVWIWSLLCYLEQPFHWGASCICNSVLTADKEPGRLERRRWARLRKARNWRKTGRTITLFKTLLGCATWDERGRNRPFSSHCSSTILQSGKCPLCRLFPPLWRFSHHLVTSSTSISFFQLFFWEKNATLGNICLYQSVTRFTMTLAS